MNERNTNNPVTYEITISDIDAKNGISKILQRNGRKLQVSIPPNIKHGNVIKLGNAQKITDNVEGDILITIHIQKSQDKSASSSKAEVTVLSDNTFDKEVLRSDIPVVVDFWAPWCGPCRMMSPILDKMAGQYQGKFKFCKINVDENPTMASRYRAMSIPLLVFFKNGVESDRSVGAIPENQLRGKIEAII